MNWQHLADLLNLTLISFVITSGTNLALGIAGQAAVIPAGFGALGGYSVAYMTTKHGSGVGISLLVTIAVAAIVGLLIAGTALRLEAEYILLLTLAAGSVITGIAASTSALGGAYGIVGLPHLNIFGLHATDPEKFAPVAVVVAILAYLFARAISNSGYGLLLRGIREDEQVVRTCGANPVPMKVTIFVVSVLVSAIGGMFLSYYQSLATPGVFSFNQSTLLVAAVVVGGLGRPIGALLGAAVVTLVPALLQDQGHLPNDISNSVQAMIFGAGLLVIILARPQGLLPETMNPIARRAARADKAITEPVGESVDAATGRTGAALVARDVVKYFGGIRAADGVNFDSRSGATTVIVGPNGAGKTTIFNLLTGAIPPTSGEVLLDAQNVAGRRPDEITNLGMARSYQDIRLFRNLTAIENVMTGALGLTSAHLSTVLLRPRVARRRLRLAAAKAVSLLEELGCTALAGTRAGDLSYGDQKLVALARLLATEAHVLLLDEPVAGVGRGASAKVIEAINRRKDRGHTVVVVEHSLETVREIADWVFFMESGRVRAEGHFDELVAQPELAEIYFGTRRGTTDRKEAGRA